MANIVIGTAGHVDHGKTTLVKALTGIETDTTKEEKRRGLTINLGFAYLDLPDGQRVGIVDVPGHEKFIKNMVAGLPGINLVLLVIDAGEGVMPQTREHVDILTLLGIRNFLIVLTKVDTVDTEVKDLAIADIKEKLADVLPDAVEIIETDAVSGRGIEALKLKIQELTKKIPAAIEDGRARLNIDRVFSVKGFGTVVTGTLLDGTITVGDELTVYPSLKKVRVRNIQIHEQDVKQAEARHRTALNLTNITTEELTRGDVLSASTQLKPTWMLDVKVRCLKSSQNPIFLWDRVRLLIGTREIMARTVPLGSDRIAPGEDGFLQLRLEEVVVAKEQDHFILRSYSPMQTIAGGVILDAAPKKHRRFKEAVLASLKTKEAGNSGDMIEDFLRHRDKAFTSDKELAEYIRLDAVALADTLRELCQVQHIFKTDAGYIHAEVYKKMRGQGGQYLLTYHRKFPLRPGVAKEEFRSRMRKGMAEKEIAALLQLLVRDGHCRLEGNYIAAASFVVHFNEQQQALKGAIEDMLAKAGCMLVKKEEIMALDRGAGEVLEAISGEGALFLTSDYVISRRVYAKARDEVQAFVAVHDKITLGDFRDMTSSSRKAALIILEYMDKEGVTKRMEDYRVLGNYWEKVK